MKLLVGILHKQLETHQSFNQIQSSTLCVTKYIWEHTFKIQSELTWYLSFLMVVQKIIFMFAFSRNRI
jgi:hypothetical protein